LAEVALVATLILVLTAAGGRPLMGTIGKVEVKQKTETTVEGPLPKSGGPVMILPAADALLVGSGALAYAALRPAERRR
jgi:hypothetical protein